MITGKACNARKEDGSACGAPPLKGGDFCVAHSPDHADEMQEARRLGGLRRRKERTLASAYEFDGLGTAEQIRRLVEIAVLDTLSLENSVARARTLAYLAQTAAKLLETGNLEQRLHEVESALEPRLHPVRR
jgi:hypothetical protein